MRPEDLPRILEIEASSFSTPWTEAMFRGLLRRADTEVWVAEAEDGVVGYAAAWAVLDQAELGNIAVAPDWRRRGIGATLLEKIIERMGGREVRELFLEVRVSNGVAQRLYEAHGFRVVGRRPRYYTAPVEDALVMCRRLDG